MKKSINVVAPLLPVANRGGLVQPHRLVNLRPVCASDAESPLELVTPPAKLNRLGAMKPLCALHDAAGAQAVLCARDTDLALIPRLPEASFIPVVMADAIPGDAHCAVLAADCSALVMTNGGPVRVGAAAASVHPCEAVFPPVSICAEAASLFTEAVAHRKLSRSYSSAERFNADDADKVIGDLVHAYTALCAKAATAGELIQPTLLRYKLVDVAGKVIFTSAPTVVSHSSGAQCAGGTSLYSNDGASINAYTLQAHTYRLRATFAPTASAFPRAAEVAECRIYMAPLFHPYIPGARSSLTAHNSGGSQAFVTAHLPGEYGGLGNGYSGNSARLLKKALARMDLIEQLVGVVPNPFRSSTHNLLLSPELEADAAAESTALRTSLRKRPAIAMPADVWLSAPHVASARCVATDASTILWGGLRVHAFRGYSAANFAAAISDEAWSARSTIVMADGSVCSFAENFSSGAPTAFSPLLCYPHPQARRIHITILTATATRYLTRALEPDESGRYALSAEDSPLPVDARVTTSPTHPTGTASVREFPDYIAVADAATPLSLECLCRPGGEVRALATRKGTDQSWEFGRFRFLAGTSTGVYSVSIGAGRRSMAVRRLCDSGVAHGSALCIGDDGEAFALVEHPGAEGPALMHLPATGRPKLLAPPAYFHALMYDHLRRELWTLTNAGYATVFCADRAWHSYRVTDVTADEITTIEGVHYLSTASAMCVPLQGNDSTQSDAVTVNITAILRPFRSKPGRVEGLTFGCTATTLDVDVALDVCNISGGAACQASALRIYGALKGPVTTAIRTRPAQAWRIGISGTVSPDFVFNFLNVDFNDGKA